MTKFEELANLNVNDKVEEKNGLSYLTWSWAWDRFKRAYPDATYTIIKFDGVPYHYDPNTGYLVMTEVTADGQTLPMWLPVMDSRNRAMKSEPYELYKSTVSPATMFDINKTLMRCLVKNLAMFGLGLYIYAGEDLPTETTEQAAAKAENLEEAIKNCKSENELSSLYKQNKAAICANQKLLELVSVIGRRLKREQAA